MRRSSPTVIPLSAAELRRTITDLRPDPNSCPSPIWPCDPLSTVVDKASELLGAGDQLRVVGGSLFRNLVRLSFDAARAADRASKGLTVGDCNFLGVGLLLLATFVIASTASGEHSLCRLVDGTSRAFVGDARLVVSIGASRPSGSVEPGLLQENQGHVGSAYPINSKKNT